MDGVIDLQLNVNAVGSTNTQVEIAALTALEELFQVNRMDEKYDNVMLCLPFGSSSDGATNWIAYAGVGGYRSIYNGDFNCANEVVQLHEVGHNFGLR